MNPSLFTILPAALVAVVLLPAFGCESSPNDQATPASEASASCAGATVAEAEREYHPRLLRGRVLAPFGKLASRSLLPHWLVGSAHAAPLDQEQTVAGATVELYRVESSGERAGEVLRQVKTDVRGEWCMKLPDGVDFGADLMLEARIDQARLRRSVASELATDLYSTSEALTRLLEQREVDFTDISPETYLNMESIAATTVGLTDPVVLDEGDGVDEAVETIVEALEADERLISKIEPLPKRSQ